MRSFTERAPVLTYPVCLQASGTKTAYQAFGSNDYSVVIDQSGIIRYSGTGVPVTSIRSVIDGLLTTTVDDQASLPQSFSLDQNFPNPFNPSTTIGFTIASTQRISLTIFDEQGRLVRRLIDNSFLAGSHALSWNGLNDKGKQVASGIYYYRLATPGNSELKKMILMR